MGSLINDSDCFDTKIYRNNNMHESMHIILFSNKQNNDDDDGANK